MLAPNTTGHPSLIQGGGLFGAGGAYDFRLGADLSRGVAARGLRFGAPEASIWPQKTAVFDFDFVNGRYWTRAGGMDTLNTVSGLTIGRASSKTYMDENGLMQTAGSNVLPITFWGGTEDWSPDPTRKGVLLEPTRTNYALWCRDASNAVWTKTDVSATLTATGLDGVGNSASVLTATANNGTCLQSITLASGLKSFSIWLKRISGTGTIELTLDGGATWTAVTITDSVWRRKHIKSPAAMANPIFGVRLSSSGDSIAWDCAMLENSTSYTTFPILTTTATVTRAEDQLELDRPVFDTAFNQNKYTYAVSFVRNVTHPIPMTPDITLIGHGTTGASSANVHSLLNRFNSAGGEVFLSPGANINQPSPTHFPLTTPGIQAFVLAHSGDQYKLATHLGGIAYTNTSAASQKLLSVTIGARNLGSYTQHACSVLRRVILFDRALAHDAAVKLAMELGV